MQELIFHKKEKKKIEEDVKIIIFYDIILLNYNAISLLAKCITCDEETVDKYMIWFESNQ